MNKLTAILILCFFTSILSGCVYKRVVSDGNNVSSTEIAFLYNPESSKLDLTVGADIGDLIGLIPRTPETTSTISSH